MLPLASNVAKQQALQHIVIALQILNARECVVAALSSHSTNVISTPATTLKCSPDTPLDDANCNSLLHVAQGGGEAPANVSEAIATVRDFNLVYVFTLIFFKTFSFFQSARVTPESELENPVMTFQSLTSSASLSSKSSKLSASAMSVIAATVTSHAQVIGSSEPTDPTMPMLDDFACLLSQDDARVLVDFLKLAIAGRAGTNAKETISNVLIGLY